MRVIKRNGSEVDFDELKIKNAIEKANKECGNCLTESKINSICEDINEKIEEIGRSIGVEEIQDIVENTLMEYNAYNVARLYIRFRYKKEVAREYKDDFFKAIEEKLSATNVENQNANLDEASFGGRVGEASSVMTKQYALDNLMSKKSRDNHLNNRIYIHDLNSYAVGMHNCLSIPFDDLLAKGFNTRQIDVRPANSVNTAFQLVAVVFQLQSLQQFGGVSATHIDWTMIPYVRKSFLKHYSNGLKYIENEAGFSKDDFEFYSDASIEYEGFKQRPRVYQYAIDMTTKETYQAVEGMYHNLKIRAA